MSDGSPQDAVIALMAGTVPERSDEIAGLWLTYHPAVFLVEDRAGITLDATKDRITFDAKTMDLFWLIGFAGWRAIECYMPHVMLSTTQPLNTVLSDDADLDDVERAYRERLAAAKRLIAESDAAMAPWPPDLPRTSSDRDALSDVQYAAAFDLTCLAAAFTFFHEFRHVMLDFDGERPSDRREEELACDVWAREFMTAKAAEYAQANGHQYAEVLRKRAMGLALAALVLHEITPLEHHDGNCDYFSIKTRLVSLLQATPLPDDDPFWLFAASLLLGVYRQKHIRIDPAPMSARSLAEYLLDQLPD